MAVTIEPAVFMGKNYQNKCHSISNTTDLILIQMFDVSTKLVSEQDEISGLETIGWENHSWKYLSLIGDERIINLQRTKVYVFFGFCMVSWKDPSTSEFQRILEEQDRMDQIFSKLQKLRRNRWRADLIRLEHLPRIQYVAAQLKKSKVYCTDWQKHQKISQEEFYS